MTALLRTLTPLGWLAAALVVLAGVGGVSVVWDRMWAWAPWSNAARLERAQTRAVQAEAERDVRTLELELTRDQTARLEAAHARTLSIRAVTSESVTLARRAHDAEQPLDPDRAERLRAHDRRLCEQSPVLCSHAAPDPAGDGDPPLPPAGSAARAEPG